jgi:hypothetical protein
LAGTVDILGYSLVNLLRAYQGALVEAICRGAKVTIIVVDPTTSAGALLSDTLDETGAFARDVRDSLIHASQIQATLETRDVVLGEFAIKLTSWIPSCSMILIDRNEEHAVGKIGINSPSRVVPLGRGYRDRWFLVLRRDEYPTEFEYFSQRLALLAEDKYTRDWDNILP